MEQAVVEVYGMSGCSSCLRLKEFVEKSGRPFVAINVEQDAEGAEKLNRLGLRVPMACIGDRFVTDGRDLRSVAELINVPYPALPVLSVAALRDRGQVMLDRLCGFLAQMPMEVLDTTLPNRERPIRDLAYQSATILRAFLDAYESPSYSEDIWGFIGAPDDVRTTDDLIGQARETAEKFREWWELDGAEDPLDRVVTTAWGHWTLHEILERTVWHTAHHVRQIQYVLEQHGVEPPVRLTPDDLAGLPMPDRVHE